MRNSAKGAHMERGNKGMFVGEPLSEGEAAAISELNATKPEEEKVVDPLEGAIYNVILSELGRGSVKPADAFDDLIDTRKSE